MYICVYIYIYIYIYIFMYICICIYIHISTCLHAQVHYPLVCISAGVAAGLLGIGGGMLKVCCIVFKCIIVRSSVV